MKSQNILFLDIDGVMNDEEYFSTNLDRKGDELFINKKKVELLNTLADKIPGLEIVISSSWGEDAIKPLKKLGLKIYIDGSTEHFHEDWITRGNEIERYLLGRFGGMGTKFGDKYRNSSYNYAIVDDNDDILFGQAKHFVQTDERYGLTEKDIQKIVEIFENG